MSTSSNKIVEYSKDAYEVQERYDGKPHAWIQWKGTDVCMDVYCECGAHFHIDSDFAYHVECPACKKVYFCNGHIELIELKNKPDHCVVTDERYYEEE